MAWVRPLQFRGKPRLFEPWTSRLGKRRATVFNAPMLLDTANYVDRMIWTGCYEPLNVWRFRRILSPGDVVVDAGANIGFFSVLAAAIVGPGGKVIAVEPHPDNLRLLRESVRHLSQVSVGEYGLDEAAGTGHVAMADQELFANRTASMVGGNGHEVATRTVDSIVDSIGEVDLLKIDVDGYEMRILRGAEKSMRAGLVRNLIVEISPHWFDAADESIQELDALMTRCAMVDVSRETSIASMFLGRTADRHYRHAVPAT